MKLIVKNIFSSIFWVTISFYFTLIVVFRFPIIQNKLATATSTILSLELGTKVEIDKINPGYLNRFIVDGMTIYDKNGKIMLYSSRLSASIEILSLLLNKKISISSAQIFGLSANIYKHNDKTDLNCQFLFDKFSSSESSNSSFDLHIASLVIRNGKLNYDCNSAPYTPHKFSLQHIALSNISCHLIAYKLNDNNIDIQVKSFSMIDQSELELKKLKFGLVIKNNPNQFSAKLSEFYLALKKSSISSDILSFECKKTNNVLDLSTMIFNGDICVNKLSPYDIQPLVLTDITHLPAMSLVTSFKGSNVFSISNICLKTLDEKSYLKADLSFKNIFNKSNDENKISSQFHWDIHDFHLYIDKTLTNSLANANYLPKNTSNIGNAEISGNIKGSIRKIQTNILLNTKSVGKAEISALLDNDEFSLKSTIKDFALDVILNNNSLGATTATLSANGKFSKKNIIFANAKFDINEIILHDYKYHDININSIYEPKIDTQSILSTININDKNIQGNIDLNILLKSGKIYGVKTNSHISNISPSLLNLTDAWGKSTFSFDINSDIKNCDIMNLDGFLSINNFIMHDKRETNSIYKFENLKLLTTTKSDSKRYSSLSGDFCNIVLEGTYQYKDIPAALLGILNQHLNKFPGIPSQITSNSDFSINASINSLEIFKRLANIDVILNEPLNFNGYVNGKSKSTNMYLTIPSIKINDIGIKNLRLLTWTPSNSLNLSLQTEITNDNNKIDCSINTVAKNNEIKSSINWKNLNGGDFSGILNTTINGYNISTTQPCVKVTIEPSNIHLGDSIWHLHSDDITYSDKRLVIENFALENESQHLFINGTASQSANDSIIVDLKNINVEYIMNLINFHSVEFAGYTTGKIYGKQVLSTPQVYTHLDVENFRFQDGHLGDLSVNARLNNESEQIDIDGMASDNNSYLGIKGYVSPQHKNLDLDLDAQHTRLDLLESFCSSFMEKVDVYGTGNVRVYGPFSAINLTGKINASGSLNITPLNCAYSFKNINVDFFPNDIRLNNQQINDKYGNVAHITGGLHHHNLSNITYDFDINAKKFLAYDFPDFNGGTFYGTAFLTGECGISGKSAEVDINVRGTADPGSIIVYNASSPDAISNQEFITWNSDSFSDNLNTPIIANAENIDDVRTNIHMNLLFNVTNECTLKLLMDENSGDYIELHGNGALNAKYYNKGNLDLFGNFHVASGMYRMTIQNVLRRDFSFIPGSIISFNGDPYLAKLSLKALYTLNSVSLSDLNLGHSFSNNNVKVDCKMNIEGTAGAPTVDFDLDLPTVNTDVKQMIYSLINTEDEMRQQVIYLLAVGRFYTQGVNNASTQNNSSMMVNNAVQSILSGTLSQQIGNILGTFINSSNWSIGANISPGNEGFSNAEYEGIFNGSLFNNRLHINGQIGYRDNAATSAQGFIGDFDIRYLLTPNGNVAVKVYNQANDRYFTRNSLNTQGIGLVLKTEFSSWRDLIFWRRRK